MPLKYSKTAKDSQSKVRCFLSKIISDRGLQFTSKAFKELLNLLGIKSALLLQFFLFCFVYLCHFIIFRSESWRCHFDSLLFDSYHCHTIDSQHCRSTDSQHSHTHSAATLVQYIQWTVLQTILQLVFNRQSLYLNFRSQTQ